MDTSIVRRCELLLDCKINSVQPIGGGDINEARLLQTDRGPIFLKFNQSAQAAALLSTEAQGLALIASADCIATPQVLGSLEAEATSGLLLSFIDTALPSPKAWASFGQSLAKLHRQSQDQFGLDHDNFIGSLPQANGYCASWAEFYQQRRLAPQVALAVKRGLLDTSLAKAFERLYARLDQLCPAEPPALIHGDLWSGNFLIDKNQRPVLIDPSVSYAHREMDLAMSRLFGGFDPLFYSAYEETFPLVPGFWDRMELYQLYYLLVHVNLFGWSYVGAVKRIVERYA